jgi:hypothetical protein
MIVIRDVFRCKPGRAKVLIEQFKTAMPLMMEGEENPGKYRILVDAVATYWTVVIESEAESLAAFEKMMSEMKPSPEAEKAMEGYMDNVDGGYREIFRVA